MVRLSIFEPCRDAQQFGTQASCDTTLHKETGKKALPVTSQNVLGVGQGLMYGAGQGLTCYDTGQGMG